MLFDSTGQVEACTASPRHCYVLSPRLTSVCIFSLQQVPTQPVAVLLGSLSSSHGWLSLVVTFDPQIHLSREVWILKSNVGALPTSSPLLSPAFSRLGDSYSCFSTPWELSETSYGTSPMQITSWFLQFGLNGHVSHFSLIKDKTRCVIDGIGLLRWKCLCIWM